ncbi:c-type cytochrome domain-containing protein [Novipirellula sp.]|uniref:c-type cytochrome domain-containing protein n=1 Tax=Novipirellula sp. TaxID=2795430 RepID=UPI00356A4946
MKTILPSPPRVAFLLVAAMSVAVPVFADSDAADPPSRVTVQTPDVDVVILEKNVSGPAKILDDEGRMVNFQRDIAPIFVARCLECHGPKEAKNDFRVDDVDSLMGYVEAEDIESSSLYVDYLTTDDEDMLMPPAAHGGPLTPGELALVRVWISEGAHWPEGVPLLASAETTPPVASEPLQRSLPERAWAFQGYLHPATVHFPIALLTVGALFVVLGMKWPEIGTQIPLACLILGALSSVAATAMGWSFATQQGYAGWDRIDFDSEVFWHRWSGIIVTIMAVVLMVVAAVSVWKDSIAWTRIWKVGLLVVAGIVGLVGHQGGELSYGKDFYPKAFRVLFGTEGQSQSQIAVIVESKEGVMVETEATASASE